MTSVVSYPAYKYRRLNADIFRGSKADSYQRLKANRFADSFRPPNLIILSDYYPHPTEH